MRRVKRLDNAVVQEESAKPRCEAGVYAILELLADTDGEFALT